MLEAFPNMQRLSRGRRLRRRPARGALFFRSWAAHRSCRAVAGGAGIMPARAR